VAAPPPLEEMAAAGGAASTARRVAETAARIFGNVLGNGLRSGRKYLARPLVGDKVLAYYPQYAAAARQYDPMFEDPDEKQCVRKGQQAVGTALSAWSW
jgi:Mitochondrial ribosomal subunit S27